MYLLLINFVIFITNVVSLLSFPLALSIFSLSLSLDSFLLYSLEAFLTEIN